MVVKPCPQANVKCGIKKEIISGDQVDYCLQMNNLLRLVS